jgi:hypothetical protein
LGKENIYKVIRIREGKIDSVLDEFRDLAKAQKAMIVVFHDVRGNEASAHDGTHAKEYITPEELKTILEGLNESGYSYQTYKDICN